MNKLFSIALAMTILGGSTLFASAADARPWNQGVNGRQYRQQNRIGNGLRSGSLTGREAVRLERQQAHLNQQERRMRRSGGGLSRSERARLEREQNQMSRNIRHQKHDGQHY